MAEGFVMALVLVTGTLTLGSVLNGLVRSRRERRIAELRSKVQMQLLEKFQSSSEALEFLASEAGAQFANAATFERSDTYRRLIGSLQVGIIAIFAGAATFLVRPSALSDVARELYLFCGVLGIGIGLGFVVSSLVGMQVTKKLDQEMQEASAKLDRSVTELP